MFAEVVPVLFLRPTTNTPVLQPVSLGLRDPRLGMMLWLENERVVLRYSSKELEVMLGGLKFMGFWGFFWFLATV